MGAPRRGTGHRILGSLCPDSEEMQRECMRENASYKQCKEAMNPDRKIRMGFQEEGLREKRYQGHYGALGEMCEGRFIFSWRQRGKGPIP